MSILLLSKMFLKECIYIGKEVIRHNNEDIQTYRLFLVALMNPMKKELSLQGFFKKYLLFVTQTKKKGNGIFFENYILIIYQHKNIFHCAGSFCGL